jgi:hypothetical protein
MLKKRTWQPLTDTHKDELILLLVYAHQLAQRTPSMRRLATQLIKVTAWRWTADAINSMTGEVVNDAIKIDIRYFAHTAEAATVSAQYPKEMRRRLTHEHTIPLKLLAEKVFTIPAGDKGAIREIFDGYCWAALITNEEDRMLSSAGLRSAMPPGWKFGDDLLARYNAVGIKILPPLGGQFVHG